MQELIDKIYGVEPQSNADEAIQGQEDSGYIDDDGNDEELDDEQTKIETELGKLEKQLEYFKTEAQKEKEIGK